MGKRILAHPFLTVFFFALIAHSLIFAFLYSRGFQFREMTDGSQYMRLAQNVIDGRGFSERSEEPYVPDAIRTPGYPLFLAVSKGVTGSFTPTLFIGLFLGAFIPLAGMLLLILLGRSGPRELLLVGVALSVDPHLWYYSLIFGSEALFLPLVAAAILASAIVANRLSVRMGFFAGLLLGFSVLVRPIVQFVPFLLALFLLTRFRRAAWKTAVVLLAGYALAVSPWIVWTVRHHGVTDFSNVGWFNMYTRVAATTEAIATHRDYDPMRIEYLQRLHDKGFIEKTPVEEIDVHGYEWKKIFQKETLETIKKYPRAFVISQVSSFWTVISQDLTAVYLRKMELVDFRYPGFSPIVKLSQEGFFATIAATWGILSWPILISIVGRFVWFVVFLLSLWAVVVAWKRDRKTFPVVLFLVLYELYIVALSLNAAAQTDARYRAQFVFAEIPLAAFALAGIVRSRRRGTLGHADDDTACPACGSRSEVRLWGRKRQYPLYRCHLCGARFVFPRPTSDELRAFYSDSYFFGGRAHGGYVDYDADKRAARDSLVEFCRLIEIRLPEKGKMLDVGAATGAFLDVARERGWSVSGHEISEDAATRAREKQIPMTTGELSAVGYADASFDAVTLLDVIEHVPDPAQTAHLAAALVRPGGIVLFNTPDSGSAYARLMGKRWHAYNPPEHLTIFNRRSLSLLAERAGLDVVWTGKVKKSFRLSYILHTLSHWTRWAFFSRIAAAIEGKSGWNPAIPLNLRDNIVVIARKRVQP